MLSKNTIYTVESYGLRYFKPNNFKSLLQNVTSCGVDVDVILTKGDALRHIVKSMIRAKSEQSRTRERGTQALRDAAIVFAFLLIRFRKSGSKDLLSAQEPSIS